jgi:hypothetical protein
VQAGQALPRDATGARHASPHTAGRRDATALSEACRPCALPGGARRACAHPPRKFVLLNRMPRTFWMDAILAGFAIAPTCAWVGGGRVNTYRRRARARGAGGQRARGFASTRPPDGMPAARRLLVLASLNPLGPRARSAAQQPSYPCAYGTCQARRLPSLFSPPRTTPIFRRKPAPPARPPAL